MYDYCEQVSLPWHCIEMPTAIARIRTDEGFVIAADCRAYDHIRGEVVSDDVQKIFQVPGQPLAYSISGDAQIEYGGFRFDFSREVQHLAQRVAPILDVDNYAIWLGDVIQERIIESGRPEVPAGTPLRSDELSTMIHLDGYRSSSSGQWTLCFHLHRRYWFSFNRNDQCIGSKGVSRVLADPRDTRLLPYKRPAPKTIEEAKVAAVKYIRAHTDEEAALIDPLTYRSVGKRIHMATITPETGFRWVEGYEPPPFST